MKSYKIFILFVLLSVVSFSASTTKIDAWVERVDFNLESKEFELTIKTRTGKKFDTPQLLLKEIVIKNGEGNSETHEFVTLVHTKQTDVSTKPNQPKFENTFIASISIPTPLILTDADITISGEIQKDDDYYKNIDIKLQTGNINAIDGKDISTGPVPIKPGDVTLKIYEDTGGWVNGTTGITGEAIEIAPYRFTKGGANSLEANPGIYVTGSTGEGINQMVKLNVEKNNNVFSTIDLPVTKNTNFSILIDKFKNNDKNIVTVRPESALGFVGDLKTLDFVLDTQVNTLYLEGGIIGEIDGDRNIRIDLSKLIELAGVTGYSYVFTVEKKPTSDSESNLNGQSTITLSDSSVTSTPKWEDGKVEIPTSGFVEGSKATLLFTVYDKLGHKKTFEKTYFIPKQLDGIISKVTDEAKQRKSKIRVVTDGNKDEFGIESNIDKSNE